MSGHLTRSKYHYEGTLCDANIKMEADVYSCKKPMRMTMNNPQGHKNSHGLGANPGTYVNDRKCDMVFVMREC